MADISITITADPSQAVQGLEQVDQAAKAVAESAKKVQSATDAASTDAINSVSTVSREVAQTISQTGSALDSVAGGIKTATSEAGKVAGAFKKSIPVIGQIGSAISQAITGPIGAVSAAVGIVIAGIRHMIQQVQDDLELMQRRAEGKTNNAYDVLMQGRKDYADQLQVLAQVREINRYAEQNKLTTDQLAQFRQLAGQIGIAERDVGDRGIREGKLSAAARSLRQQRERYAAEEYRNYTTSFDVQLLDAVMKNSDLSIDTRNKLGSMNTAERVRTITQAAKLGQGADLGEYKAWQDLYSMVKQYQDVVSSYGRDKLLGRDQSVLNDAIADSFKKAADKAAKDAGGSGGGTGKPLWKQQEEADKAELDAQAERERRGRKLLESLDRQIAMGDLVADGKEKEAFMLKNRLQYQDSIDQQLTAAQIAEIDARSERLWELQHPQEPDLAPEDLSGTGAPARARAQQQQYTPRLDRLQQIGANLRNPAANPDRVVWDRQLSVQENIYHLLQTSLSASRQIGGLMFP